MGFSEPISLNQAQVLAPDGRNVLALDAARAAETGLRIPLPADLDEGTYTVSYHVVSLDGHPIAGSLLFSVGAVTGATRQAGAPEVWHWAFVAVRVVFYLGLFGAAGGVAYARWVGPSDRSRDAVLRLTTASAVLGLLAAFAAVGLQGGLLLGAPLSLLHGPETWRVGMNSTFGRTALCAMAGLALVWAGCWVRRSASGDILRLIGAVLVLTSFALSGHVVTAGPRWLTTPPLLLHAAVAAFWIGSLLPLHRALARPVSEAGPLLQRFSRVAVWAVPVLIAAGLVMAWFQVRHPEALVTTDYGRTLLAKLILVGILLGLAALNRFRLTPGLMRGNPRAVSQFGWSIRGEIGLVVGVLAATAILGTTPPPRAMTSDGSFVASDLQAHEEHGRMHGGRSLELSGQRFAATVVLTPGQVGSNSAVISLRDPRGQPLDVLEVSLRLINPGRGIAPLERVALREDIGTWQVADLVFGVTGQWEIELEALISDFERQTLHASVDLSAEGAPP